MNIDQYETTNIAPKKNRYFVYIHIYFTCTCPHVPQDALKEQRQDRMRYVLYSSVEVYFAYVHLQI